MNNNASNKNSSLFSVFVALVNALLGGLFVNWLFDQMKGTSSLEALERTGKALLSGEVWRAMMSTVGRFSLGFLIALVSASIFGIAIGMDKRIERFCAPAVGTLKNIPSAAIIPFAMFAFQYGGITLKLFIIVFGCFWPILLQVIQGTKDIDRILIDTGRTLGKGSLRRLVDIVIPACLPAIMVGARVGLGIGLLLAVTSEVLIATNTGIGYLILDYERSFKQPEMFGAIIVLGLTGWLLDLVFKRIEKLALPWHSGRFN